MPRSSGLRRIARYFGRYRGPLLLGAVCLVAGRYLMVLAPRFLRDGLNVLEQGDPSAVDGAVRAAWAFFAASAGAGLFSFAMRRLIVGTSRHVERDLKRDLFEHVERLPVAFFDRTRTGDLLSRLTSDVEAVRFALGPGLMYVATTFVLFPLALQSMIDLSGPLTVAALVPLLLVLLFTWLVAPSVMKRSRSVQDRIGDLSARAQESFSGARVVRAYATEDVETSAFRTENEALVRETIGLAYVRARLTAGLYLLGGLTELAVFAYGGWLVTQGSVRLGDLGAFLAYTSLLMWPMISIGWVMSAFQRSTAAVQRLDEVMNEPAERSTLGEPATAPDAFRGDLRVEGLTFAYPGVARPVLTDVAFETKAGSTLALVGPVGAGKSTLLRLLTRLYEPPPGTVFLDGIDVTRISLERLRAAFAAVPQDAFLFSDTILGNLAYADPTGVPPERAMEAADVAGLAPDLQVLPRGLDTLVGERGVTLSGGQKQRATLARALLREAPVLLLDDALSAVDTQTEERILERLEIEFRRRTVIVVAHRLSTVRHADRILVLDGGRVAETGTHEELVQRGGWYARTYQTQRLEAELETWS